MRRPRAHVRHPSPEFLPFGTCERKKKNLISRVIWALPEAKSPTFLGQIQAISSKLLHWQSLPAAAAKAATGKIREIVQNVDKLLEFDREF